ncbi:MAG: GNAT family N-acetyltransferase [Deltaproteobacteria bacterium]|nr:GNAT family N-acetyltransferase [Deltaproteobacteria bacterium]
MRIAVIADPGPEWDAFVETEPAGQLGHASAWARVVHEAYGLTPVYLEARDERGAIAGILPLVEFRGLSANLELVSMPFLDSGGILARDPATERALLEAALEEARARGARVLELREIARDEKAGAAEGGVEEPEQTRVDLVMALESDEDAQWRALRAKVRNQTRKAESEGLTIAPRNQTGLLAEFYRPFCRNMRDLGSPVHAERFFSAAAEAFGDRLRFVVTRLGSKPVGGLVAIDFAGAVTVPWASTLREERRRCPNNQIYWEALRWAIERGAREFDFGRSPIGGGTYRFKRGWGAEERPLAWKRLDSQGKRLAPKAAGDSASLRRLSAIWSRLPVWVTTRLGPPLRRRISS